MKIDNSVKSVGGQASTSRNGAARPAAAAASAGGSELALSPLSAHLQEISAGMANTPAVDTARVAQIKQAIAEGRFQVDAGKIADGLIASVRQMLSKG
ncbi:anti-sigma28 factor FlgM [mine drainage metagenome]|uniref:Negative regulator of flagellin synthesis n=1 Tax=mine drainage metagenome TaxID=410659 RepID=A0A1J5S6B5_9ZZZZ